MCTAFRYPCFLSFGTLILPDHAARILSRHTGPIPRSWLIVGAPRSCSRKRPHLSSLESPDRRLQAEEMPRAQWIIQRSRASGYLTALHSPDSRIVSNYAPPDGTGRKEGSLTAHVVYLTSTVHQTHHFSLHLHVTQCYFTLTIALAPHSDKHSRRY